MFGQKSHVSATLLLSHFLRNLARKDIPPEVEEHRARLRRASGDAGPFERALKAWLGVLNDWHQHQGVHEQLRAVLVHLTPAQALEREKELKEKDHQAQLAFQAGTKDLIRALEETSARVLSEAPSLESQDALIRMFKEKQVYQLEPFMVREFIHQDENNNEEYRGLLEQAVAQAIERARATFVPDVKKFNMTLGGLAFLAANCALLTAVFLQDSPLRMSIGSLVTFDVVLGMAYVFYKMSRKREEQLRAHIQVHVEREIAAVRAIIAKQEEERYKQFLEEERERREAFEREQEVKREAFERAENQRLEGLQPLFTGKTATLQAALSSLLPLRLPVPVNIAYKVHSGTLVEVTLQLPDDRILPPALLKQAGRVPGSVTREEQDVGHACTALAAALAIRHATEIMFNLPTCQTVVVNGTKGETQPGSGFALNAEIDRRTLGPMGRTASPLVALKRFKHRIGASERKERRSA